MKNFFLHSLPASWPFCFRFSSEHVFTLNNLVTEIKRKDFKENEKMFSLTTPLVELTLPAIYFLCNKIL